MCLLAAGAGLLGAASASAGESCGALEEVARLSAPVGDDLRLSDIVVIAPDDAWAVGYYWTDGERFTLTAHYDGASWEVVPSPSPGVSAGLNAVDAVSSDDVWAAGDYMPDGAATDSLVLHWDGLTWEVVPSPGVSGFGEQGFSFASVEAVGPDDVWFTGTRANRALGAFTAHWNGSDFAVYPTPALVNRAHELVGVSAVDSSSVWGAGGTATIRSGGFVLRWDGSAWNTVLAPDFGGPQRYYQDVVALSDDDVWVSGMEFFVDDDFVYRPRPYFIHWDGAAWTDVPAVGFAAKLKAFSPTDIYGISGHTLVHWDGSAWTIAGSIESPGQLDNLISLDGTDPCGLQAVGQVESGNGLAGWVVEQSGGLPGDLDGDGDVDLTDLSILLGIYGTCDGDAGFDATVDIDGSGCVDLADLSVLLGNYGS